MLLTKEKKDAHWDAVYVALRWAQHKGTARTCTADHSRGTLMSFTKQSAQRRTNSNKPIALRNSSTVSLIGLEESA